MSTNSELYKMNNDFKQKLSDDELLASYGLLNYVLRNIEKGNFKVKIQLVDILKKECKSKLKRRLIRNVICILRGSREVRVTCVIISILNSLNFEDNNWVWVLRSLNADNFIELTKKEHDFIRKRDSNLKNEQDCFEHALTLYKQCLNGRVDEELDWEAEMKKRVLGELCYPKLAITLDGDYYSEIYFDRLLEFEANELFNTCGTTIVESIDDFMDSYFFKIVGGSYYDEVSDKASSKYKEELANLDPNLKFNKRTAALTKMYEEYRSKLKSINLQKCRLKTKAHQKTQEQVKARSIYQTTMLHYLVATYVLTPIEEQLNTKNIFMNSDSYENLAKYSYRLKKMKGRYVNSFDFEDFNAQHMLKHMHIVLKCVGVRIWRNIKDQAIKDQYEKCYLWLANAVFDTYTYRNGKKYQWKEGLPTGVRYTSFMNNLLNYFYTVIMYKGLNRKFKQDLYLLDDFEVCGDDSWHAFGSDTLSSIFNEEMKKCGHSLQISKQMTSAKHFEFLRLQYYLNDMIVGCLNRSISNFVCGNWEDDGNINPVLITKELYPNMVSAVKRGLDNEVAKQLFTISLENTLAMKMSLSSELKEYRSNLDKAKQYVRMVNVLRCCEIENGGWSMMFYGEKYIFSRKQKGLIKELRKVQEMLLSTESKRQTIKCDSIGKTINSVIEWTNKKVMSNVTNKVEIPRLQSTIQKLATEGAYKMQSESSLIANLLYNDNFMNLCKKLTTKLSYESRLPLRKNEKDNFRKLLICDNLVYGVYFNNIEKLGAIQSLSSVNMDIIKFWLVESALPGQVRKLLFQRIFKTRMTNEKLQQVTSVKINSKGKFEKLYESNPSIKLQVIGETESIYNACYAVDRGHNMYQCILIKEFACRVTRIIMRN